MNDGSSSLTVRFEILGPVRAYRGAEVVDLGPIKQRALLAVLLLNAGRAVPMGQIIAALWNGDPPENGIDVVQRFVGGLRRALDPERTSLIALADGGYVLRAGENAIDVERFRASMARAQGEHQTGRLDAAAEEVRTSLGLWQGEPLAGLTGPVFESARFRLNAERATASQFLVRPMRMHPPEPESPERAPVAPARATPPPADPTRAAPARLDPTRAAPARLDSTRAAPARLDPTRLEPVGEKPEYPEAVDPWEGHDLFPPDPAR
ncbi:transcriptional regulator [Actinoplanes lutulentus]|uniref:Transcriptional regulator n=2 Tax=Actinoplanes lutulentus TaxID=1287878 RepID=A0A327Z9I7_9ACTN|nr:transcriptional regulator [Actinoplanes lutulentus]